MTLLVILLLIAMNSFPLEGRNCRESCNQKIDYICGVDNTTYINPCYLNCRQVKRRCFGKCPCVGTAGRRREEPAVGLEDAFRKCEAKCANASEEGFKLNLKCLQSAASLHLLQLESHSWDSAKQ